MSPSSIFQKFRLHSTISSLTSNICNQYTTVTITRYFSSNFTKGIDWTKRKKILRIRKYKQQQSLLEQSQSSKKKTKSIEEETNEQKDMFLEQVINPSMSDKTFVKQKYDEIHGIPDDSETVNYKFRPALFTKMIKGTRSPKTLLTLWLRDREKCPIDHINTSAAIVHLSQLCLEKVQPQQIYEKTMAWGVIRLIRDVMFHVDQYEMRQIANVMWGIGVLTSNNNDNITGIETQKIHRDFRRVTAKLLTRFESDIEIRRKCNVQNMVDMLWTMNCVGLKVHKFFYQFCVDLYCKLDIDIGVTPDALAYLSVLYAVRVKLNEKIRIKPKKDDSETESESEDKGYLIYNEVIPKRFWMKLLKEFCDDFVLIEAEPHHVANVLWALGRIGNKYLNTNVVDVMEEQWIIENVNKLLTFVQHRLAQCDGQTISILLWCVTCSNFRALMVCKKHSIFDYDKEMSVGSRILQLIESEDCYIIPSVSAADVNANLYVQRYANKAYNIGLNDCIVVFEAVAKMEYSVPVYILTLMLNRMKEQLKYSKLNVRELICLLESVDMLRLNDDMFHAIMARKLVNGMKERGKNQWNYSEFIGLLGVINKSGVLYKNLDLVYGVLNALQFSKQGWGQMDGEPIQLLDEQFTILEKNLMDSELIIDVDKETITQEEIDDPANVSVLVSNVRNKISKRLLIK